ncbi:hypothetical protein [Halalkalicoccus sp. NIPERK01]|uniref:DUF7533 family protein n=1 Tax=Halalkalicoccus sp. NIPERK01 TaxID=3053469 RepID=UPI00256EF88E|nr:hypothetical protein [Halalkalicoccus sp. NIPERK01]MDL5361803.1 hypothetical protein [Halalkalicoccus sp. NIPERK01]
MKLPGIIDMIQLGSGLIFAIPLGLVGFEFLAMGRTVFGVAFLVIAAAMLLLPEYVARQVGSPREWLLGRLPFRRGD